MSDEPKLSSPEIESLRQKAARGISLTIEEVRKFVQATRRSFLAVPVKTPKAKAEAKPKVDETQIDFF